MIPRDKLDGLNEELIALRDQISDTSVISDAKRYKVLMRRFKELSEITEAWDRHQALENHLEDTKAMLE